RRLRGGTEGKPGISCTAVAKSGTGTFGQFVGIVAHAPAGIARNYRTGRVLAKAGVRSGSLVAPSAVRSGVGGSDFYPRIRWRDRRGIQSGCRQAGRNDWSSCGSARGVFDYGNPLSKPGTGNEQGEYPLRHSVHAGNSGLIERPEDPAATTVRGAQQLQLGSSDRLGGFAHQESE